MYQAYIDIPGFSNLLIRYIIAVLSAITIAIILALFKKKLWIYVSNGIKWILNIDIRIKSMQIIFVAENMDISMYSEIKNKFIKSNFFFKFIDEKTFNISRDNAYIIQLRENLSNVAYDTGEIFFSFVLTIQNRNFSYRTGINKLTNELYDISEVLSSLSKINNYHISLVEKDENGESFNSIKKVAKLLRKESITI